MQRSLLFAQCFGSIFDAIFCGIAERFCSMQVSAELCQLSKSISIFSLTSGILVIFRTPEFVDTAIHSVQLLSQVQMYAVLRMLQGCIGVQEAELEVDEQTEFGDDPLFPLCQAGYLRQELSSIHAKIAQTSRTLPNVSTIRTSQIIAAE